MKMSFNQPTFRYSFEAVRNTPRALLPIILLGMALCWVLPSFGGEPPALVNGNFEDAPDGKPAGWADWGWAPNKAQPETMQEWLKDKGRDGSAAVRIAVRKTGHVGVWCNTKTPFRAEPGKEYELKAWVRIEGDTQRHACRLSVGFSDDKWQACEKVDQIQRKYDLFPTGEWQLLALPVTVPKEFTRVRIDVKLESVGSILIDDVSFTQINKNAVAPGAPFVACALASAPPFVDGQLDDNCWRNSIECASFLLTQNKGLPKAQSSAWLAYDQKNLYVAFRCVEPYLDPVLNQMDRFKEDIHNRDGTVWCDDCVEVFLQPSGQDDVFHLIVNSKGTVFDESRKTKAAWNADVNTKGFIGKDFWTLEMAIPFDSMRVGAPSAGQMWRMNLCRARQPVSEFTSWAPVPRAFNTPEAFGFLRFADVVPGISQTALSFSKEGEALLEIHMRNPTTRDCDYLMPISINCDSRMAWATERSALLAAGAEKDMVVKQKVVPDRDPLKKDDEVSAYCDFQYVLGDRGQTYYQSACVRQKFGQVSQPISSQLSYYLVCEGLKLVPMDGVYVVEGAAERMVLSMTGAKPDEIKQVEWVLEVPAFCALMSPMHHRECVSPLAVAEEKLSRDGTAYRRYRMTFDPALVSRSDDLEWYFFPLPLFLKVNGAPTSGTASAIYFHAHARLGDQECQEKERSLPLVVLPPYSQKRPLGQAFKVWPHTPYFEVTQHSDIEEEAIFRQWVSAGVTIASCELEMTIPRYRQMLRNHYGMQLSKMTPILTAGSFPGAVEYLKSHPGEAEQSLAGKAVDAVCLADLLNGASGFSGNVDSILGRLSCAYDWLEIDYEFGIFGNNAIGYSARNVEMFRTRLNLEADVPLTPETLQGRFRNEWVDFRCWQNGEMLKLYQDAIRKANGRAKVSAYSGYQRENEKRENYGVDWRYMGKYSDLVMCGYGRGTYEATRAAIGPEKNTCAGLAAWSEEDPPRLTETKALRCITDLGGLMFFYAGMVDGRSWKGISQATTVATDFKEFFPPRRANHLAVDSATGNALPEVSVLTHGDERLVFVFNETDKPKTVSFTNKDLPSDAVAVDYWLKTIMSPSDAITACVKPNSVNLYYICRKNQSRSDRPAPSPATPGPEWPPSALRPVFVWSDPGRTSQYAVEYRKAGGGLFSIFHDDGASGLSDLPETACQTRDELLPGQQYEWRVRAHDVVLGVRTPWSDWQSFTVPTVLNADVVPRVVAPGAPVRFQADVVVDGGWKVVVRNDAGAVLRTFDGEGRSIVLASDARDQKGESLCEGKYVGVFHAGKGLSVEVPFEVDKRRGSRNPAIESLGPWRLVEWETYFPDEPSPSDFDCEVSHSGSYSLRIRKQKSRSHSPYWCNFRHEPTGARLPTVKAGENYRFTVWVKTAGKEIRANAAIGFLNESKNRVNGKSVFLSGEHDWQEVTVTCQVPPGAVRLTLGLSCEGGGEGTAWFDECKLERLPRATAD